MTTNLKTTHYNDGTAIPLVTVGTAWANIYNSNLTTPAYCWYNNDSITNKNTYGGLYNWYAVNTGKLAPKGWHVATDSEWTVLENVLGDSSVAGGPLKEAGTMHWASPNTGATNSSGFSALPGGGRDSYGVFSVIGTYGSWWSSTAYDAANSWYRGMFYSGVGVFRQGVNGICADGFSVRCVKDNAAPVAPSITMQPHPLTVTVGGSVTFSVTATGTAPLSYQWYIGSTAISGAASASYSISNVQAANAGTYTVTVSNGTLPNVTSNGAVLTVSAATGGTVTDIDGNVYNTVAIGTQVWMVENLKTTKYNDGTPIPLVTVGSTWINLTTGGYCWYNDSIAYGNTYGALYNWHAVNMGKLAPNGWHVPSDSEWTVLTSFLGGLTVAGGALKESGTTHWLSPNTGATNSSGFSALPGGYRNNDGSFLAVVTNAYWWCSPASGALNSWYRDMAWNYAGVDRNDFNVPYGFSVRCVKDTNANPDTNAGPWTTKTSMSTGTAYLGCAVLDNKIYAIGGNNAGGAVAAVEEYDPATDVWTAKPNMTTGGSVGAAVVNDSIYVIVADFSLVYRYDPLANTWTARSPLLTGGSNMSQL